MALPESRRAGIRTYDQAVNPGVLRRVLAPVMGGVVVLSYAARQVFGLPHIDPAVSVFDHVSKVRQPPPAP